MADYDDTDLPLPPPPPPPVEDAPVEDAPMEDAPVENAPTTHPDEQQESALVTSCRILFKDDYFAFLIHLHMKNILKDGRIDAQDVPDIVAILVELLKRQPKLQVTADDLPEVMRVLLDVVLEQFDVHIPALERATINKVVESSIRLVLLQPRLKAKCSSWLKTCWCF